jgi:transcriptional regulator with XRE-family HTH domain
MTRASDSEAYGFLIEALVARRRQLAVTQSQLAGRLGRPQSYISKIELRERRLDIQEFCDIARALGLPPAELLASIEAQAATAGVGPSQ